MIGPLSRPHRPLWGPLAGGAALQVVRRCRRWASAPGAARLVFLLADMEKAADAQTLSAKIFENCGIVFYTILKFLMYFIVHCRLFVFFLSKFFLLCSFLPSLFGLFWYSKFSFQNKMEFWNRWIHIDHLGPKLNTKIGLNHPPMHHSPTTHHQELLGHF